AWRRAAEAHASGRASGDDVARLQTHELADVVNEERHIEDHVARDAALHWLAVHIAPELEITQIIDLIERHQCGADRAERIAAFALVPLAAALKLECAFGHVM